MWNGALGSPDLLLSYHPTTLALHINIILIITPVITLFLQPYQINLYKGVEGAQWACGFRNLQMLLLSLVQVPDYRTLLFTGTGEIPDIHGLQCWIEKAWAAGFDIEGFRDFCEWEGQSPTGKSKPSL